MENPEDLLKEIIKNDYDTLETEFSGSEDEEVKEDKLIDTSKVKQWKLAQANNLEMFNF